MVNKKKLLFIWNYFYLESEKGNSRFATLLNMLSSEFDVEVVTSSFYHMEKKQHNISKEELDTLPYKLTFINEPGYQKNVSFKRLTSMSKFNKGVKRYLNRLFYVPDIIYVPVPSIKLGLIANKYAKEHNSKLVIDIEDLWPESFMMLTHSKWLNRILFAYQYHQENKLYKKADALIAVSQTYLDRALKVRKDNPPSLVTYIGSDYIKASAESKKPCNINKPDDEFWITYIGTLGKSYDLKNVIDSFSLIKHYGHNNIKLKILGSGPNEKELKEYASKANAEVEFVGLLKYGDMIRYLCLSDLGINPIVPNSVASIINKVADYASVGLPVINTQNCKEYMDLIDNLGIGYNLVPLNRDALAKLIIDLSTKKPKKFARSVTCDYFDRSLNYPKIINLLMEISKND